MRRTTRLQSNFKWRILASVAAFLLLEPLVSFGQLPIDTAATDTITFAIDPVVTSMLLSAPATNVRAADKPNDHGHAIVVSWDKSADDGAGQNNVMSYKVLRTPRMIGPLPVDSIPQDGGNYQTFRSAPYGSATWGFVSGEWDTLGEVASGLNSYDDNGGKRRNQGGFLPDGVDFQYKVLTTTPEGGVSESSVSNSAEARGQFLSVDRLIHIGIPSAVFMLLVFGFVQAAQRGRQLYIRPLAGINAVDEAIGRATEMNRPILYVLGLGAVDEIATIASLTILSRVAKRVAEHRTELLVPCYDAVVMTVAQETVKQAYLDAGRPDEYKEDSVYYVVQEQFAYVAAVNGTMLRRQTVTNFYIGVFFAESLILAETGSVAGSIQISGTDRTTQIPFFVVACDYTLIGEEVFAASAYLSREPKLLGTLKAQDYAKLVFLGVLVAGCLWAIIDPQRVASVFTMNF